MKVYVLTEIDYIDTFIVGVYSTRELADRARVIRIMNDEKDDFHYSYYISEKVLDQ